MDILLFLSGLALFLFGMHSMGESLEKVSGGKLESVLENMTNKQYKGVLLGAGVTAVTQSSSAVTVMVVGFVNSGIMRLSRAVSIIMGANIGTTLTAWFLSLAGIRSDNFFLKLFKPSSFAPVFAVIGMLLLLFARPEKLKNTGAVLAGFGVLMLGMGNMSSAMASLADNAAFTSLLVRFNNPFLGILAGALLTAVIQSSSASVGILQALSLTGAVSFQTAFPIILGQNVGTCATTLLSAAGASKNAKRAAVVHLYFNLIGVAFAAVVYYALNAVFQFPFALAAVSPVQIAAVHSAFNIFATLLLLPFSKQLEALAVKTIKSGGTGKISTQPDESFFISPSYTVEKCRELACKMANTMQGSTLLALALTQSYSSERACEMEAAGAQLNAHAEILKTYILRISRESISRFDSKTVFLLHQALEDFEKAFLYCQKMVSAGQQIANGGIALSANAAGEIMEIGAVLTKLATLSTRAFCEKDAPLAKQAAALANDVHGLQKQFKSMHMARLGSGECSGEHTFLFLEIISAMGHVAEHFAALSLAVADVYG